MERGPSTLLVGRGRVGRGLHARARGAGGRWELTSGRRPARARVARAGVIVLAVPDGAIRQTAARIAPWLRPRARVLHCAGSRTPDELAPCREAGAWVGAMHPLASFADPKRPPDLRGVFLVVSGDRPAVTAARRIAAAIGARVLALPVHGPAYHALAAMIAGGTVGFVHATIPALESLGLGKRDAERAAAALVGTVAGNISRVGLPAALTGPVVRGDADTVARHRAALREISADLAAAYDAVAPLVLECAASAGVDPRALARLRQALREG